MSAPDGATQALSIILSTVILSEIKPHTRFTEVFVHEQPTTPSPTAQQKMWDTTNASSPGTQWAGPTW